MLPGSAPGRLLFFKVPAITFSSTEFPHIMNTSTLAHLQKHFDLAIIAPDGIKRLRELILTLAMQGKLVPQDLNDQPACELLKEIEAQKKRLVKEGKIKEPKPLPEIKPEDVPYEVPKGWEWVRLGGIAQHNSGKTLDGGRNTGILHDYITTSNLYWGRFELSNMRQMPIREDELEKCTVKKNDLLICEGGEAGRAAVWFFDKEVCFQNHIHRVRFYHCIDSFYAYRLFELMNCTGVIEQYRKGVGISNMSSKALASIPFPLPPLAEQKRIVAKIDQLMAACDVLEKQRNSQQQMRQDIHSATITRLLDAANPADADNAWNFVQKHFSELYSVKENVAELRKAILQLAVMGKLARQDPKDQPASEILKEIEDEKKRLVKEGKIKAFKPLPEIKPEDVLYVLPNGWEWVRLDDILLFGPTNGYSPNAVDYETGIRSLTLSATTSGIFKPEYYKNIVINTKIDEKLWLTDGDILIQRGNALEYVGVSAIYRGPEKTFIYPDLMMKIKLSNLVDVFFIHRSMSSEICRKYLRDRASGTSGTMPKINQETVRSLLLPLPPLAEQKRIVAKVDELMKLCDKLEQGIDNATKKQSAVLEAVVAQV
jgi:type I restriction enzyme S subunit